MRIQSGNHIFHDYMMWKYLNFHLTMYCSSLYHSFKRVHNTPLYTNSIIYSDNSVLLYIEFADIFLFYKEYYSQHHYIYIYIYIFADFQIIFL